MKPAGTTPCLNMRSKRERSDEIRHSFPIAVALILLSYCVLGLFESPGWAYREYFTPEQRTQLEKVQTVFVDVLALTDKGTTDSTPLTDTVVQRLAEVGYSAVRNAEQAHDVVVRVKCEQRKTWEGTSVTGGDADLPDAPSRLWKGPACQLTYLLGGMKIKW